ncbi:hypothetical protein J6590_076783 [Homalodisca vitripennis]|nr:hypothetical protein J6590_076783 [Homalodisca vitripennis]
MCESRRQEVVSDICLSWSSSGQPPRPIITHTLPQTPATPHPLTSCSSYSNLITSRSVAPYNYTHYHKHLLPLTHSLPAPHTATSPHVVRSELIITNRLPQSPATAHPVTSCSSYSNVITCCSSLPAPHTAMSSHVVRPELIITNRLPQSPATPHPVTSCSSYSNVITCCSVGTDYYKQITTITCYPSPSHFLLVIQQRHHMLFGRN